MATQVQQQAVRTGRSRHRFTIRDYHRMIEAGILDENDKVELVGGEVVEMSAMGGRHAGCLAYLDDELRAPLAGRAQVRQQLPITIPHYDEPEPDMALVRPRADRYRRGHPGPEDVLLIIEVSDTTLAYDRGEKLHVYASAAIPETWIADLATREGGVERHSDPDPDTGAYRIVRRFGREETVTSPVLPGVALPVRDILGPSTACGEETPSSSWSTIQREEKTC